MAAEERQDEGRDLELDDPAYTDADDVRAGYIADHFPQDPEAQADLAVKLLESAHRARLQAERQATLLEKRAEKLALDARVLRLQGEETAGRREGLVRNWFALPSVRRFYGDRMNLGDAVLRWAKKRRSYKLNDAAVIALAAADPSLYAQGIVALKPTVDGRAARKRFVLAESGDVIDNVTGEVLGPVVHDGPDGTPLTSPVLTVTEPGYFYTAVIYTGDGTTEEESGSDGGDGGS